MLCLLTRILSNSAFLDHSSLFSAQSSSSMKQHVARTVSPTCDLIIYNLIQLILFHLDMTFEIEWALNIKELTCVQTALRPADCLCNRFDNNVWLLCSTSLYIEWKFNALAHTIHACRLSICVCKHGSPRFVERPVETGKSRAELSAWTELGDSANCQTANSKQRAVKLKQRPSIDFGLHLGIFKSFLHEDQHSSQHSTFLPICYLPV